MLGETMTHHIMGVSCCFGARVEVFAHLDSNVDDQLCHPICAFNFDLFPLVIKIVLVLIFADIFEILSVV